MSETPFVIQGGFEMRLQAAENRCRICIVLTVGGRFILRGIACRLSFFFCPATLPPLRGTCAAGSPVATVFARIFRREIVRPSPEILPPTD